MKSKKPSEGMAQTVNKPLLKNASENWLFKIANQRRFFMLITKTNSQQVFQNHF